MTLERGATAIATKLIVTALLALEKLGFSVEEHSLVPSANDRRSPRAQKHESPRFRGGFVE